MPSEETGRRPARPPAPLEGGHCLPTNQRKNITNWPVSLEEARSPRPHLVGRLLAWPQPGLQRTRPAIPLGHRGNTSSALDPCRARTEAAWRTNRPFYNFGSVLIRWHSKIGLAATMATARRAAGPRNCLGLTSAKLGHGSAQLASTGSPGPRPCRLLALLGPLGRWTPARGCGGFSRVPTAHASGVLGSLRIRALAGPPGPPHLSNRALSHHGRHSTRSKTRDFPKKAETATPGGKTATLLRRVPNCYA